MSTAPMPVCFPTATSCDAQLAERMSLKVLRWRTGDSVRSPPTLRPCACDATTKDVRCLFKAEVAVEARVEGEAEEVEEVEVEEAGASEAVADLDSLSS